MGLKKRGIFFSLDALIALLIVLLVLLVAVPNLKNNRIDSKIDQDILFSLSSINAEEFDNDYVQSLISSGIITQPNKSLLEQIGNLYVTEPLIAKNVADEFLSTIKTKENIGIWIENNLITSKNSTPIQNARQIETSRQIISGIMIGENITGYSARAFLSSNVKNSYSYFGGYSGDGNITLTSEYNGTITGANLELTSNKDFELYINGIHAGNYSKSPSTTQPSSYELSNHIAKFQNGINKLEFVSKDLYISGGFLKIKYQSEPIISNEKRQYFQGVQGLINLYDGVYIPQVPDSININLDLESNFTTFLNIGNVTVFNSTTNGRQNISLSNSLLSSLLNYNQLSNKTTPVRLGLRNVSLIYTNKKIDLFSVVDLSGSMAGQKMTNAKTSTNTLIDTLLNISGNRVGLVGFEYYSKKSDFHNLSNSSSSLKNIVNNEWDASGYTCVCCGILKAISCFDNLIFEDKFNDQSVGSNPLGWTVSKPGSSNIEITSNSLEGNRAVEISRGSSNQNPTFSHIINPEENKLDIEFLVRHDSGSGRFRLEIEGQDSSGNYQDYIILKMYNGQIRNDNTAVTPYSLNTIYKIRTEITPSTNTYKLYVDDTLISSSLSTTSTRSNVARLSFKTENAAINYKIDAINISLTQKICDLQTNKSREMIVMSDGEANRACGLDPSPDWDGDSVTINDPQDQAIEAACRAKSRYNITVHSIALDVFNGSLAEQTMQGIAACGGGGFYVSNVSQLANIYGQITNNILATYSAQSFNSTANQQTRLYPNSYISMSYAEQPEPFGIPITIEKSFSNATSVNFSIPHDSTPVSVSAISYSGNLWTNKVRLNNQTVYDLSNYGSNYIELGDPYAIKIDPKKLSSNNTLTITTVSSSGSNETASNYNKVIYTVIKNISAYSPISANRDGCTWTVHFEDNSNTTLRIPQNYIGTNLCVYSPTSIVYNGNDAMQIAAYNLFRQLDLDLNGKIDFLFNQNEINISTTEVQGIPFPWSTEIQVRRWI